MSKITIETESLMTVKGAAELAGVTRTTIYRWIASGRVTTVTFGNIKYVSRADVDACLSEN